MLSPLLKGPFNSLSPSPPSLDLPGMQDTGTFITPLQTWKGTDLFFACSTPCRALSPLLSHQAYVPAAMHTQLRHQDSSSGPKSKMYSFAMGMGAQYVFQRDLAEALDQALST